MTMKRLFSWMFILTLLTACGSNNSQNAEKGKDAAQNEKSVELEQKSVEQIDSAYYHKTSDHVSCTLRASLPAERLNQAVGEWLDESLGGLYPGDPTDIQGIIDYYGTCMSDTLKSMTEETKAMIAKGEAPEEIMHDLEYEMRMEQMYETSEYVTYSFSTYTDLGGAHPSSSGEGVTFRKKDGRRVGWDIFASRYAFRIDEMIKEGLKEYFEVESDEDLQSMLTINDTYFIPRPQTPPYLTKDGIVACYQQYEIAPYAAGMPNLLFPYDKITPYLTGWGKRLLKK